MNSFASENMGNALTTAGPLGYLTGSGLLPQLVLGLVLSTVLYIVLMLQHLYQLQDLEDQKNRLEQYHQLIQ